MCAPHIYLSIWVIRSSAAVNVRLSSVICSRSWFTFFWKISSSRVASWRRDSIWIVPEEPPPCFSVAAASLASLAAASVVTLFFHVFVYTLLFVLWLTLTGLKWHGVTFSHISWSYYYNVACFFTLLRDHFGVFVWFACFFEKCFEVLNPILNTF